MALINITPVMTSNTTPSPYVVSASSENDVSQQAWKAFDSAADTFFHSGSGANQWLKIDFGSAIKIDAFSIKNYYLSTTAPKDFILYGSLDDTNYEKILECNNEILWSSSSESRLYKLQTSVTFRYYKIITSSNNGYTAIVLMDVKFWQDDAVIPAVSNSKASMNYMLPHNTTLNFKQRVNDIREGLLSFANDDDNYGTLWMINKYGQAKMAKAMMANSDVLFDGNANSVGDYSLSKSILDYQYIIVKLSTNNNSIFTLIKVSDFKLTTDSSKITFFLPASTTSNAIVSLYYASDTSFHISELTANGYSSFAITKIYGN